MIKFFRKIREQLIMEKRFSKYLIYAVGEILLVVIGILIALQLDNWNQNIKNETKETEHLLGLKEDLEKQINLFDTHISFCNQSIDTGESILSDFIIADKLIEIDSYNKRLSALLHTLSYPDVSRTFKELNTTGQLHLIKEKTLRSEIITFYQNSASNKKSVDGNLERVNYDQIFPTLKSAIIVDPGNFGFISVKVDQQALTNKLTNTLENILDNPNKEFEIINAITLRILVLKNSKARLQKIKDEAELLLAAINSELNLN